MENFLLFIIISWLLITLNVKFNYKKSIKKFDKKTKFGYNGYVETLFFNVLLWSITDLM